MNYYKTLDGTLIETNNTATDTNYFIPITKEEYDEAIAAMEEENKQATYEELEAALIELGV